MKKSLIAGFSRIVDSQVMDSNKRLDEYVLGSLRKNGLESMANIEEHKDGIRVSLQGYPFAYVDIYLDGEKVVADYSRNAQEVYPGTVKKYAQFAGIPEEQAKSEVEKFYKWMHVLKDHTGGLVDDIQKLKVSDSEEETEEVKDFRVYVKKSVKDKVRKALEESEYEFEDVGGDYFVVHGVRDFKKFNDYLVSYDVDFMDFLVDEEA
jgi:glutamine synthetase type III